MQKQAKFYEKKNYKFVKKILNQVKKLIYSKKYVLPVYT